MQAFKHALYAMQLPKLLCMLCSHQACSACYAVAKPALYAVQVLMTASTVVASSTGVVRSFEQRTVQVPDLLWIIQTCFACCAGAGDSLYSSAQPEWSCQNL